jgi:hypothetical protein
LTFTSSIDTYVDPFEDVIPENTILLIPKVVFSIIEKLLLELFSVVGVWNIPFMNTMPFPPVL